MHGWYAGIHLYTQCWHDTKKGVLDLSNDVDLNKFTPEDERPIPFRNMIYIGDGLTDVPCMKLVKTNGGYSIAVYQKGKKSKVAELLRYGRVDFLAMADYSENSELDTIVRDILCKMAMGDSLKRKNRIQIEAIKGKNNAASIWYLAFTLATVKVINWRV
jgi:hypothetical protein